MTKDEALARLEKARKAITQILDDGQHISDYDPVTDEPIFNRNEKQGSYCYAAAEQAMEALSLLPALREYIEGMKGEDYPTSILPGDPNVNGFGFIDAANPQHIERGVDGWQPIETAPVMTRVILTFNLQDVYAGKQSNIDGLWYDGSWGVPYPNHWIPLPKPPTTQPREGE